MRKKHSDIRLTDKPIYRYWQALFLSFFSSKLYVDVVKRWKGFGFRYFAFVIAFCIIPFSVRLMLNLNQYFNDQIYVIEQIPFIPIQEGRVKFDKPMPYFIKNKIGEVIAIIDTTGKIQTVSEQYPNISVLITQNKLFYRPPALYLFFMGHKKLSAQPASIQDLSDENFISFDDNTPLKRLKWFILVVIYPIVLSFFLTFFYLLLLILAVLGKSFSRIFFKVDLNFKQSSRLLTVASTPQFIIFFTLAALNWFFNGIGVLLTIVLALYFSYGAIAVKRFSKKMVLS